MNQVMPVYSECITPGHIKQLFPGCPDIVRTGYWTDLLKTQFWVPYPELLCPRCNLAGFHTHSGTASCIVCDIEDNSCDISVAYYDWKYVKKYKGPSQWICALLCGDLASPNPQTASSVIFPNSFSESFAQRAFACYLAYKDNVVEAIDNKHIHPEEHFDWYVYVDWRLENTDAIPPWALPFPMYMDVCNINKAYLGVVSLIS